MSQMEFFFDFASPYAYLAHCRLPALADKHGYGLVYKPIDLIAAKRAAGNTGPATVQIPPKFRYVRSDLMRWAQKYGVPFEVPIMQKPAAAAGIPKTGDLPRELIDSSRAHKGVFFARERGQERDYVTRVYQATFGSGRLVGDDEMLSEVARQMGWSPEAFFDFIRSDQAERLYDEANKEAQSRGVFGVPTMIVGDEMWWGNDRLGLLEEYLTAHPAD